MHIRHAPVCCVICLDTLSFAPYRQTSPSIHILTTQSHVAHVLGACIDLDEVFLSYNLRVMCV
jgi:hypothetical protein